jgi:hypothetical protein
MQVLLKYYFYSFEWSQGEDGSDSLAPGDPKSIILLEDARPASDTASSGVRTVFGWTDDGEQLMSSSSCLVIAVSVAFIFVVFVTLFVLLRRKCSNKSGG